LAIPASAASDAAQRDEEEKHGDRPRLAAPFPNQGWTIPDMLLLMGALGALASVSATCYLLLALWCVARYRPAAAGPAPAPAALPPVSILKPLCGAETGLYESLRSFCAIDHPDAQIVFGVRDTQDPAIEIVARLQREFHHRDIALLIDPRLRGANLKVGNLINMLALARHDIIIVSDSDVTVGPDAIARVLAPFADAGVGAVTCLYRSAPRRDAPSILGGLFIDSWFLSSAVVDATLNPVRYCYGPLSAVRRDALARIGGFEALADQLADDYELGQLLDRAGYRVVLSDCVVDTAVAETWRSLVSHELRWGRTVRICRPWQHVMAVVMWALPLAALTLAGPAWLALPGVGAPLALRLALHGLTRRRFAVAHPAPIWLVPVRELLCFAVWAASLAGRDVVWRGRAFRVLPGGVLVPKRA
jgi:ceramide glucosyltransferase